jgi:ATP-dependent Clp protease protease subunit
MAGDTRTMGEGSFLMVHRASGLSVGNAEDMRNLADILEGIDRQLVDIYASRTGIDPAPITELMTAETWLNAQDAVAQGFADGIGEPLRIAAHVNAARFHNVPASLKAMNQASTPRLDAYRARMDEIAKWEAHS